jgi:hypothetical protein
VNADVQNCTSEETNDSLPLLPPPSKAEQKRRQEEIKKREAEEERYQQRIALTQNLVEAVRVLEQPIRTAKMGQAASRRLYPLADRGAAGSGTRIGKW